MKRFSLLLIVLGCMLAVNAAANECDGALNCFRNHALPVLVHVNAKGKVTQVQPAIRLRANVERELRKVLDQMITKPAMVKDRPVASQFVINLALNATPREDGKYNIHFSYVSAMPVPGGGWYWLHVDGRRLALVSNDSGRIRTRHYNPRNYRPVWNSWRSSQPATQVQRPTSNPMPAAVHAEPVQRRPLPRISPRSRIEN
jgi:ribosomal protein L24E